MTLCAYSSFVSSATCAKIKAPLLRIESLSMKR